MPTKTLTPEPFTVYTIDDHPEPDKVFQWVRANWHDLNDHTVSDVIESLKALAEECNLTLDYSISQHPDRGEFIKLRGTYDRDELIALNSQDCPLTGCSYDHLILEALLEVDSFLDNTWIETVLNAIQTETEYQYSDEGLRENLSANVYYFHADGSFYHD